MSSAIQIQQSPRRHRGAIGGLRWGVVVGLAVGCLACASPGASQEAARAVLDRYLEASGGIEAIRALQSVALTAQVEAYGQQSRLEMLADGRWRIEGQGGAVIFDGTRHWRTFHGLAQPLTAEEAEPFGENSLWQICFHGLLGPGAEPPALEDGGRETSRGQIYERLVSRSPEGIERTYYFSAATGLLEKLIERIPDADLRERKNVHTFGEYQEFGSLRLATRLQGQCLTNNLEIQPLTRLTELEIDGALDAARFTQPVQTAPAVTMEGAVLHGQVLALSGGGSLITNFMAGDLGRIGVVEGSTLFAGVKERELSLPFHSGIEAFTGIGRGDYLATFNGTPALWLVKAYVGMRSDDSTYAAGDPVRLWTDSGQEGQ